MNILKGLGARKKLLLPTFTSAESRNRAQAMIDETQDLLDRYGSKITVDSSERALVNKDLMWNAFSELVR